MKGEGHNVLLSGVNASTYRGQRSQVTVQRNWLTFERSMLRAISIPRIVPVLPHPALQRDGEKHT